MYWNFIYDIYAYNVHDRAHAHTKMRRTFHFSQMRNSILQNSSASLLWIPLWIPDNFKNKIENCVWLWTFWLAFFVVIVVVDAAAHVCFNFFPVFNWTYSALSFEIAIVCKKFAWNMGQFTPKIYYFAICFVGVSAYNTRCTVSLIGTLCPRCLSFHNCDNVRKQQHVEVPDFLRFNLNFHKCHFSI